MHTCALIMSSSLTTGHPMNMHAHHRVELQSKQKDMRCFSDDWGWITSICINVSMMLCIFFLFDNRYGVYLIIYKTAS